MELTVKNYQYNVKGMSYQEGFKKGVSRPYAIWHSMMSRCYNRNNHAFKNYGAKGISVTKRWHKYENFIEDMSPFPPDLTLDRINGLKGYSKSNCRWATQKQQQRNRLNNKLLTIDGETKCVAEWAEIWGVEQATLRQRIRLGHPTDKLKTKGLSLHNRIKYKIGDQHLSDICKERNISYKTVIRFIKVKNLTPEEAIEWANRDKSVFFRDPKYKINGRPVSAMCREFGVNYSGVLRHIKKGKTPEESFNYFLNKGKK